MVGTSTTQKRGRNASRVGMACVPCRQSKLKCDGDKPRCQRCAGRDQSCYWVALDGRSSEAKKRRRSSIDASAGSDQLELLANAAVQGEVSSSASTIEPLGDYMHVAQPGPSFYIDGAAPLQVPPTNVQSHHTHTADVAPLPIRAATAAAFPVLSDLGLGNVGQQMWWERGVASTPRRVIQSQTGPASATPLLSATDPIPNFDLASLGLEPQFMTDDMMDMLTGRVVWIDQLPSTTNDGSPMTDNTSVEKTLASTDIHPHLQTSQSSAAGGLNRSGAKEDVDVVRMQYFRLMGPTGISPGIKKITMELKLTPTVRRALFDSNSSNSRPQGAHLVDWERLVQDGVMPALASAAAEGDTYAAPPSFEKEMSSSDNEEADNKSATSNRVDYFDGDVPAAWVIQELIPIFFDRLGDHYLCLNRHTLELRLGLAKKNLGTVTCSAKQLRPIPPMLLNVMCALASRFSSHPRITNGRSWQRAHTFGKRFARKAKEFLVTSLAVPSSATVLAFIMMAWHEFACNLDSAFWNYGGMGLRMAIDLGLQRYSPVSGPDADLIDDGLLFWAVYMMDRHLCVGTGRPTSIKDREITCPQPSKDQLLFAYHISHVRIGGRIAETINAVLTPDKNTRAEIQHGLDLLEAELIRSYESIPAQLRLTAANFKASYQKHLFFEFHLWFHNLLLILNRSPIVEMRTSVLPLDAIRLVRKSVQKCADILAMDDTYENEILKSVPMANQTLFLAGCAELDELNRGEDEHMQKSGEANNVKSQTSRSHLMHEAQEGYKRFADALERISVYWDGVRWIHGVLSQRELGRSHTDLVELAVGTDALVSKREMRLLKRHGALSDIGSSNEAINLPVEISNVGSLDELTSLLPQVQSAIAAHTFE